MSNKWKWCIVVGALLLLVAVIGIWLYSATRNELTVTHYEIKTDLDAPVRLVQLSDLHSWEFGEDNAQLVELVAEQEPDLILMTGDMLDKSDENADIACGLIRQLVPLAPVYYGYGNHERAWEAAHGQSLTPELEAAGAVVLHTAWEDVEVKGQLIRIGGYHGYYRRPHMSTDDPAVMAAEEAFFDSFESQQVYTLLLNHIPTGWLDWDMINSYPVDLVLTGHYHGGQVKLPLIGGLIAPYVGWFPEFTEGIYDGETATCILSTGLGSSPGIPRVNNPPQIVVVDLVPGN